MKAEILKKRSDQIKQKLSKAISLIDKLLRQLHSKNIFNKFVEINE